MPNTKTIILDLGEDSTGKTVVCKVQRDVDDYYLDNSDGVFKAAPVDNTLDMAEDSTYKGRYSVTENRVIWDNGVYNVEFYEVIDLTSIELQTDYSNCLADNFYLLSVDTSPDAYLDEEDCGECGFTFKKSQLTKRFDSVNVCKWCFETEHPLDVYRKFH